MARTGTTPDGLAAERHRFLAAIVDSAEDAIFAKALDGTILSWNAAAQRMYGYTPDEIVGRTVHRLAPPERHGEISAILERLSRGEPVQHFETERVRKNGERFPVSLAISPVRDDDGRILGASTVARDITEARRLAEATAFGRSLLRAQAEASLDGVIVLDPAGRTIFANRRFREIWGIPADTPDGALGEAALPAVRTLVHDPAAFAARVEAIARQPADRTRETIHLVDGRVLDRYSAPVLAEDGRLYGRVWSFRDITAETVRLAQLRSVVAAIEDATFVFGADGHALLRNPAAARLAPGVEHFGDLQALIASRPAAAASAVPGGHRPAAGGGSEIETSLAVPGGGQRQVVVTTQPVSAGEASEAGDHGPHHLGWLAVLRDVTELRETQATREAFLGVLSHELRTPITTIYGGAKMLLRDGGSELRDELLRDIESEADRLYRLVEDLLVLTRIERDSLSIADGPVLLGPLIERVLAAERRREPRAQLLARMEPGLSMVRGEDTYLEQIIRNLIGNAIKYGPRDGTVEVVAEAGGRGVLVHVMDEGPGLAEADSDRVFELLYRSPATAAQASGSGIGLFVSRRLAAAMGGDITAHRLATGGARFTVDLPAYVDEEASRSVLD